MKMVCVANQTLEEGSYFNRDAEKGVVGLC